MIYSKWSSLYTSAHYRFGRWTCCFVQWNFHSLFLVCNISETFVSNFGREIIDPFKKKRRYPTFKTKKAKQPFLFGPSLILFSLSFPPPNGQKNLGVFPPPPPFISVARRPVLSMFIYSFWRNTHILWNY